MILSSYSKVTEYCSPPYRSETWFYCLSLGPRNLGHARAGILRHDRGRWRGSLRHQSGMDTGRIEHEPWYSDCMPRKPTPPVAAVIGFIDRINRGDIAGLSDLMTQDHRLELFDQEPVVGKQANFSAWQGYAQMCPDSVIR